MTLADVKPLILVVSVVASALLGGSVGTQREKGRGEARAVVAKQRCDSTVRVVQAQRDSVVRVVELREARSHAYASSHAGECRCGPPPVEKRRSFLSRWAPPLLGLGAGIAIGHAWAPRAVETVVNVIGDGGGDDSRKDGHYHGKRWEPKKDCGDTRWHPKHRGKGRDKH
jgi:hypothetical protein